MEEKITEAELRLDNAADALLRFFAEADDEHASVLALASDPYDNLESPLDEYREALKAYAIAEYLRHRRS